MAKKKVTPTIIEENIQDEPLEEIMGDRFAVYAKYVIQDRAIPDVRDGLKPVQRRIIYAMYLDKNVSSKPTRKCAHTVGAVMGKFHPHGDSSIYSALARMSQDWKVRVPLIDFQGNNGSIDGDSPAAYRYTEARLSEASEEMIRDLEKGTVDMQLTFDDTQLEPVVLPSRFPNLFVNGTEGIAVAVATDIPPHNLREVNDAVIYRIQHPKCTLDDLLTVFHGPDFPTGGIIYRSEGLRSMYEVGKGRIEIASKTEIINENGFPQIIIHEIPYAQVKSDIVLEIDKIRHSRVIDGIVEVRDESDREGLRIVIDLKKEANAELILTYLMSKTNLVAAYTANMVAIVDNRPKTLTLETYLDAYIAHQRDVITRRSKFDLKKYQDRLHIVNGLMHAISIVDEVVHLIRKSKDKADAKLQLQKNYGFSEVQSEAIVTMQLYKLSNTDITIFVNEKAKLEQDIAALKEILEDSKKLDKVIISDLKEISKKFGTDRKTDIQDKEAPINIDQRDLIAKEEVMVAVTRDGYVKRATLKSYKASEGSFPGMKAGDVLVAASKAMTTDYLLLFTDGGNYAFVPVHEITESRWKEEGKHINLNVNVSGEEKIIKALIVSSFKEGVYVALLTKNGQIKRTALKEFFLQRYSKPVMCMRLLKDDEVVDVAITTGNNDLLVLFEEGNATLFNENELAVLGIKAAGVKAISSKNVHAKFLFSYPQGHKWNKLLILSHEGALRTFDFTSLQTTARLGRVQAIFKCFVSNPHTLCYAKRMVRNPEAFNLTGVLSNKSMMDIVVDDFHPVPSDKRMKANIALNDGERIDFIYELEALRVDDNIIIEEPPVRVKAEKEISSIDDDDKPGYEQISIFDDMGD